MPVPLDPGADEARRWLEAELSKPDYHQGESLMTRFLRWLEAHLPDTGQGGAGWQLGLTLVLGLALVALAVLVWRYRDARQVIAERRRREGGLTDPGRSAASYRDEAERLLRDGLVDRAVVAAFRALVVALDDRDVVRDAPGRTAHEVARAAALVRPPARDELERAAWCFDRACYGHPDGPMPGRDEPQRCEPSDVERLLALDPSTAVAP